ncbi:MAG TPA: hypothetical protein VK636_01740 [Gemmatimonadaceae bacterium]|nr:hypothetical protein [Gemmatimonadaceae bacterium]
MRLSKGAKRAKRALTRSIVELAAVAAALASPLVARAQKPDSTARAVPTPAPATSTDPFTPPITPRRAFAYSFLVPGYGQSVLGRHKAAVAFLLVEAVSLGMISESGADVHEARRGSSDSLIVSYVDDAGNPAVIKSAPRFDDAYRHTRAAHVEDWIALLVANHLFSGADAFVSAHLWDVGPRLGLRMLPHGTAVVASMKW